MRHARGKRQVTCNKKQILKIRRRRKILDRYKIAKGCIDCGYNENPYALQWDHRDPADKIYTPHRMASCSIKNIIKEARKCDIRCANCHTIRSVKEKHYLERKAYEISV